MLAVNGNEINLTKFPDGTSSFRLDTEALDVVTDPTITWRYDGDHECIILWYLVNHIRSVMGSDTHIQLFMPYIPNARMDRVKNVDEVFTLKWFASFINSLSLYRVVVLDPHSNVSPALIDRVQIIEPQQYIQEVISTIKTETANDDLLLCYPDDGAAKRYSDLIAAEYVHGIKHRNWRDGKIERLELVGAEKVAGRNVLIVDDICSRGGTFTHMAKALLDAGAKGIYLYVSHCENTIFNGSLLTDGMISRVFTTNSIYRGDHENIIVIEAA